MNLTHRDNLHSCSFVAVLYNTEISLNLKVQEIVSSKKILPRVITKLNKKSQKTCEGRFTRRPGFSRPFRFSQMCCHRIRRFMDMWPHRNVNTWKRRMTDLRPNEYETKQRPGSHQPFVSSKTRIKFSHAAPLRCNERRYLLLKLLHQRSSVLYPAALFYIDKFQEHLKF